MTGGGPVRARLHDGRWHFQHGPIDLIIGADGDEDAIDRAANDSWQRFQSVLTELVAELPLLRTACGSGATPLGTIAQRMHAACLPFQQKEQCFVTPMAAVAGAVADAMIRSFDRPGIRRAYVNNGGDIALHLVGAASFRVGVVAGLSAPSAAAGLVIDGSGPVRGVATSGWQGRSFSFGIADSVTVLAATAAQADAAATLIGNAVDTRHPSIRRAPASSLRDDTDLGDRLVTIAVGPLSDAHIDRALDAGEAFARRVVDGRRCVEALMVLQGHWRRVSAPAYEREPLAHAAGTFLARAAGVAASGQSTVPGACT